MPDIPGIGAVPYGHPNDFTVYINEAEYMGTTYIKVAKNLNQLDSFELHVFDVTQADTNVAYRKIVKIFSESKLLMKGRIDNVKYNTDGSATMTGLSMGILLQNVEHPTRTSYYGAVPALCKKFLALGTWYSNIAYTGQWIIEPGVLEDFGGSAIPQPILFRSEFDNRLQTMDAMARQLEWDWYISHGDLPYDDNYFNMVLWRGSQAPVFDIYLSGAKQNGIVSQRADNYSNLVTSVVYMGTGEGSNQIYTSYTLASKVWDKLDENATVLSSPIVLQTGKGFPTAGVALIGKEAVTWIAKTANILSTVSYDTQNGGIGVIIHFKDTLAVLYYDATGRASTNIAVAPSATVATITVADTSTFAPVGSIIIGLEVVDYTSTDATHFYGCTRGQQSTDATSHTYGTYVFQYDQSVHYTKDFPQAGSPVDLYGFKQTTIVNPVLFFEEQAEQEATYWILRNGTITYEITFQVMDYLEFITNTDVGDNITITDSDTGLDSIYRLQGFEMVWDQGAVTLLVNASNRKITESTFIDKIAKTNRILKNRLTYTP